MSKPVISHLMLGPTSVIETEILLSLGAAVVAFEPQPICAREVVARGNERLTVIQKAVGETEGTAQFHLKSLTTHASFLPDWGDMDDAGVMTVSVTTLDRAIEQFGLPVFCKIDVEGFEAEVLRGLSHRIPTMSFEYHTDEPGIERAKICLNLLSKLGNYNVNLTGQEEAILLSPTWLSIPEFISKWLTAPELIKSFSDCAKGEGWGDLFVRIGT